MSGKNQGKIREKSGNFEVDDKWQPWTDEWKICGSWPFGRAA